jgi:hypothetical protein
MTDYIDLLDKSARQLNNIIRAEPDVEVIPTDDYGWENFRYRSPKFRLAHVEIFNQDRFMVVHTCVFPQPWDPSPIFGFDVIAGAHKVTGVFMDLSPTVEVPGRFHDLRFERPRERPAEWGEIFSENWIACRPNKMEMMEIIGESQRLLRSYLAGLGQRRGDEAAIRAGQDRYCIHQRKNEHTYKALKNLIGPDGARQFMDEILFPTC